MQVPLEAILNYDSDSLQAVKLLIEKQQLAIANALAHGDSQADATEDEDRRSGAAPHDEDAKPVTRSSSVCNSHSHRMAFMRHLAFPDDFDSGAETEEEEGSQVTDMSESD